MFHQSEVLIVQSETGACFYYTPTSRFIARRLIVGVVGRRWEKLLVTDIRIGGVRQLPASDALPAEMFADQYDGGEMFFSPCEAGKLITVHVWNKSVKPKRVYIRFEDESEF